MDGTSGFEAERGRLRAIAYRMLGSAAEADDAVQETWLRYDAHGVDGIDDVTAWLTTAVTRVCLNRLRSRRTRAEVAFDEEFDGPARTVDPEEEAELAESVGLAMLVVLDTLGPSERLAFVLHDVFAVPFEEVAAMLDRTPASVRQLASRARRKVQGAASPSVADLAGARRIVEAFLAASRGGDIHALLGLLDPAVTLHADAAVVPTLQPIDLQGAEAVSRGAFAAAVRARRSELALIDGDVGLVMAKAGRLALALRFTVDGGRITAMDVIADPQRLAALDVRLLP